MATTQGDSGMRRPKISSDVVDILGWPTDMISIDYDESDNPDETNVTVHTTLVFFPGNPGCCAWYQPLLFDLVSALGPGFGARLVSYAGHNPYNSQHSNVEQQQNLRDASIVWTVDGQIRHKEAFVDEFCTTSSNQEEQQLIFLSHSIGSHMVERVLMQRTDILERTAGVIHLMPFVRMKAYHHLDQTKLNFGAANPNLLVGMGRNTMKILKSCYSLESLNALLQVHKVYEDPKGRDLAVQLLRQPHYARNFFELGTEEIRDVPHDLDATAIRQITRHCPLTMLYCANDQWAPYEDVDEILQVNQQNHPISIHYFPNHKHDFVSVDAMVPPITKCCLDAIHQCLGRQRECTNTSSYGPRSRL